MLDVISGRKQLRPAELIKALQEVPSAFVVEVNAVGNLLITDQTGQMRGYIDFVDGMLVIDEWGST